MTMPKLPTYAKAIIREILQFKQEGKPMEELSSLSRFVCFNLIFGKKQEGTARNLIRYFQGNIENMIIASRQGQERLFNAMKDVSIEIIHNKEQL